MKMRSIHERLRGVVAPPSLSLTLLVAAACAVTAQAPKGNSAEAEPGTQSSTLEHGGLTRTFLFHLPRSYRAKSVAPLVIALHGGGGTGGGMERLTGLSKLSDTEGFVVAYPDGVGRTWNDGRGLQKFAAMRANVDDVGFVARLIEVLAERAGIDRERVYVTGISNGGHMAHRLGVELSEEIAAIAPVAATMPLSVSKRQAASRPVGVVQFFGTADTHNLWQGGGVAGGKSLSVPDVIQWWARHNGCGASPTIERLPDPVEDGTASRRESYAECSKGAEVILYAVEGGGHNAPGWRQYLPVEVIGRTGRDFDANREMWAFFRRHRQPAR